MYHQTMSKYGHIALDIVSDFAGYLCKESNLLHVSTKEPINMSVSLASHSCCLHGSMNYEKRNGRISG